ncbi:uncharacterized protein BDR25DRAFT_329731 [Lindgomyces ingoldianus]|uniref:Uncharacterized protein n=1 Tax=Lindgomyces ingoldianus TaxID=673940 RepID=A0ACB6QAC6_9PLEO|nr:uncharacterized protein BDR25DRAFT_329731 [Lindgomyces ingoldianus]KAF2463332.1 hypothetical protein BDR25DRAFT_329731 [Lindgomyces ingoldianus]
MAVLIGSVTNSLVLCVLVGLNDDLEFSVPKVSSPVCTVVKWVSMIKIGEGNFNKVFWLQMDDGLVLMARIPHPNSGPPKYTNALEVATMDFAHSILDIPVPKVLAYCATADNPVWDTMDLKDQLAIVTELVTINQKFLSTPLNRHGALYYKKDSFPGCETAQVTASVMENLRTDVAKRFVIGPTVEREFWEKQRANMAIDRGPWTSAREYVEAIGHREIAWLRRYAEALLPTMERWGASEGQSCPQAHINLLEKYLSHHDLHTGNLFIHKGKISTRAPRLLNYNGEIMLKLPPAYEEMLEDERRLVEYRVLRYPQGKMLSNVADFASTSWNRDILPLHEGSYNDIRDFWDDLKGRVDDTSYTTHEFFDEAVALFSGLQENGLKTLEGQELKNFEEQTRWVLDHVKNNGSQPAI